MNVGTPIRFQSTTQWNRIPMIDIAIGPDESRGERRDRAKGIIAIGDMATGVLI